MIILAILVVYIIGTIAGAIYIHRLGKKEKWMDGVQELFSPAEIRIGNVIFSIMVGMCWPWEVIEAIRFKVKWFLFKKGWT